LVDDCYLCLAKESHGSHYLRITALRNDLDNARKANDLGKLKN
jgi:hypothetical protein